MVFRGTNTPQFISPSPVGRCFGLGLVAGRRVAPPKTRAHPSPWNLWMPLRLETDVIEGDGTTAAEVGRMRLLTWKMEEKALSQSVQSALQARKDKGAGSPEVLQTEGSPDDTLI